VWFLLTGCAWVFAEDHAVRWPADTGTPVPTPDTTDLTGASDGCR